MIPIDNGHEKLKEQIKKIENETGLSKGYINLEEMWRDLDKEENYFVFESVFYCIKYSLLIFLL